MADNKRSLSELQALYADNNNGDISPNDLRDGIKTLYGNNYSTITTASYTLGANDTFVTINSISSAVTLTVPAANDSDGTGDTFRGKYFIIYNEGPNVSYLDGAYSQILQVGKFVTILSNGSNWIEQAAAVDSTSAHIWNNTTSIVSSNSADWNNALTSAEAAIKYVPYSGATSDVDLGVYGVITSSISGTNVIAGSNNWTLEETKTGTLNKSYITGTGGYTIEKSTEIANPGNPVVILDRNTMTTPDGYGGHWFQHYSTTKNGKYEILYVGPNTRIARVVTQYTDSTSSSEVILEASNIKTGALFVTPNGSVYTSAVYTSAESDARYLKLDASNDPLQGDLNLGYHAIENTQYIDFVTSAQPIFKTGRLYWDDDDKTLTLNSDISGTSLQIGQESWVRVTNKTGAMITNGSVVYINGAQGSRPTISLASSVSEDASAGTIGLVTSDIEDNESGYVTTFGLVRGIDTSLYPEGTLLNLSNIPGQWTSAYQAAPLHNVRLGEVIYQHSQQGVIFVRVDNGYELSELHDVATGLLPTNGTYLKANGTVWTSGVFDTDVANTSSLGIASISASGPILKSPNGFDDTFVDPTTAVNLSWSDATSSLTIYPAASSYDFYANGTKVTVTSAKTLALTSNTEGKWYYFIDVNGNLSVQNSITGAYEVIRDKVFVAEVYWDATNRVAISVNRETHALMPWQDHLYLHLTRGTAWESGLALNTITPGSQTVWVDSGRIADEDIRFTIAAKTSGTYQVRYKSGSGTTGVWRAVTSAAGVRTGAQGRPVYTSYNVGSSAWVDTQVNNGDYICEHIYASLDLKNPIFVITGNTSYVNATLARAGALVELQNISLSGLPSAEFKPIATVLVQASPSSWAFRAVDTVGNMWIDWRSSISGGSAASGSGTGGMTEVIHDDTLTGAGVAGSELSVTSAAQYNAVYSIVNSSSADWNNAITSAEAAGVYIPYTGATKNINLGSYNISATSAYVSVGIKSEGQITAPRISGSDTNTSAFVDLSSNDINIRGENIVLVPQDYTQNQGEFETLTLTVQSSADVGGNINLQNTGIYGVQTISSRQIDVSQTSANSKIVLKNNLGDGYGEFELDAYDKNGYLSASLIGSTSGTSAINKVSENKYSHLILDPNGSTQTASLKIYDTDGSPPVAAEVSLHKSLVSIYFLKENISSILLQDSGALVASTSSATLAGSQAQLEYADASKGAIVYNSSDPLTYTRIQKNNIGFFSNTISPYMMLHNGDGFGGVLFSPAGTSASSVFQRGIRIETASAHPDYDNSALVIPAGSFIRPDTVSGDMYIQTGKYPNDPASATLVMNNSTAYLTSYDSDGVDGGFFMVSDGEHIHVTTNRVIGSTSGDNGLRGSESHTGLMYDSQYVVIASGNEFILGATSSISNPHQTNAYFRGNSLAIETSSFTIPNLKQSDTRMLVLTSAGLVTTQINTAITSGFVPYTGATAGVNLGAQSLSATNIVATGNTTLGSSSASSALVNGKIYAIPSNGAVGVEVRNATQPVIQLWRDGSNDGQVWVNNSSGTNTIKLDGTNGSIEGDILNISGDVIVGPTSANSLYVTGGVQVDGGNIRGNALQVSPNTDGVTDSSYVALAGGQNQSTADGAYVQVYGNEFATSARAGGIRAVLASTSKYLNIVNGRLAVGYEAGSEPTSDKLQIGGSAYISAHLTVDGNTTLGNTSTDTNNIVGQSLYRSTNVENSYIADYYGTTTSADILKLRVYGPASGAPNGVYLDHRGSTGQVQILSITDTHDIQIGTTSANIMTVVDNVVIGQTASGSSLRVQSTGISSKLMMNGANWSNYTGLGIHDAGTNSYNVRLGLSDSNGVWNGSYGNLVLGNTSATGNLTVDGNTTLGNLATDTVTILSSAISMVNIPTGTIVAGGNIGLDSGNKLVKATITAGSSKSGQELLSFYSAQASQQLNTGITYYWSFIGSDTYSANRAKVFIETASTSGAFRIGIFAGGVGGAKIGEGSASVGSTTGYNEITLSTPASIVAGTEYWCSASLDASSLGYILCNTNGLSSTTVAYTVATSGALPATRPAAGTATTMRPALAIYEV